jgi:hypothetical protein
MELALLRIKEAQQNLLVVLAEIGADPHVARDGPGDARRKAFRCSVATRAVLREDSLPLILGLSGFGRLILLDLRL